MTKEEHSSILEELRANPDAGRMSELLQILDNDYTTFLAAEEENNTKIETLEKENKTLAKANNSLWLERTVKKNSDNVDNFGDNGDNSDKPEKIDIDSLDFE